MTVDGLPDAVHRSIAIVIFGLGIGMVVVHTVLAALTPHGRPRAERPAGLRALLVGAYLAVWLGLALTFGDPSNFPLSDEGSRLWVSLLVGFGPMLLGIAALLALRPIRQLSVDVPSHWLIWAQSYRMAGLMFFFPFLYYGIVPAAFAIPAGLGDFVTGALAPVVGLAILRGRPNAIKWAVAWNLFGVLDLIVAPASAILAHATVIGQYPLAVVPLFLGPPLGILTHVYSLRNLATRSSSAAADAARLPMEGSRTSNEPGGRYRAPSTRHLYNPEL